MKSLVAFAIVMGLLLVPAPDWLKQGLFIMLFLPTICALIVYSPKRRRSTIRE